MMMKTKNIIWAALSMTAALVMTACTGEDNTVEPPAAQQDAVKTIPYSVTVNGGAGTRATVDETDMKTLKFAAGDKLYVSSDSRADLEGVLTLKSGDEGKSSGATFEGSISYTGDAPAVDLAIKATLVGSSNVGVQITDGKVTGMTYPSGTYCAGVNDAVEKYSNLTGSSTYGAQSFTLKQETAFLNFEITFVDGTAENTTLSTVVKNGETPLCTANVTTTTESEKVVAKFVLPVAKGTALSSATVKMGDKVALTIKDATLTGKVYNVKRTQKMVATAHTLSASVLGDVVDASGNAYTLGDTHCLPSGVTAAGMVAYKNGTNGLVIALADEASTMNWETAKGASGAAAHTPVITGYSWKLPDESDWKNMFVSFSGGGDIYYSGLNTALAAAGGDSSKLQENFYWLPTQTQDDCADFMTLYDGEADFIYYGSSEGESPVRACLAF